MRNPGGGYGNPGNARSRSGAAYQNDYMEQQNDEQINLIAGKVGQLKELSIAIGSHVKEDNRLLGDLDNSFDSAGSLLSGTMKRLGKLSSGQGSGTMCYLAVFVLFVFLLLWRLTKG